MSELDFKSIVANDLKDVFFKIEEFSELHNINGKNIEIIKDDDKLEKINMSQGLRQGDILFYVNIEELEKNNIILNPGKAIVFDGKPCLINSNTEEMGNCQIILEYNY